MAVDSCILDIETLGTHSDSVVLSVGLVAVDSAEEYTFKQLIEDGLYLKLSASSQIKDGRKIYKDTLEWWGTQGDGARKVLDPSPDDIPYTELAPSIAAYFKSKGVDSNSVKMYARGSHFDFGILHDLLRRTGGLTDKDLPWNYWNIHDSKTVQDTLIDAKIDVQPPEFIHHNALHDAAREYMNIQTAIEMFQEALEDD